MHKHPIGDYMSAHEAPKKPVADVVLPRTDIFEFTYDRTRRAQAELAARATQESVHPTESRAEKQDVAATLLSERQAFGFYSHSGQEKDSVHAIMERSNVGYPVINYFDQVEYHMRGVKPEEPIAAIRALAHQFEDYATEAYKEVVFANFFADDVERRMRSDDSMILDLYENYEISSSGSTRRTLTSLARLRATDMFVIGAGENPLSAKYPLNMTDTKARDRQLRSLLEGVSASNILSLNKRYKTEENQRFEYWHGALEQARMRASIRGQVDESLARLDAMRPPKE